MSDHMLLSGVLRTISRPLKPRNQNSTLSDAQLHIESFSVEVTIPRFTSPIPAELHDFMRWRGFPTAGNCHMSTTCLALLRHDIMPSGWNPDTVILNLNEKLIYFKAAELPHRHGTVTMLLRTNRTSGHVLKRDWWIKNCISVKDSKILYNETVWVWFLYQQQEINSVS